MKTSRLIIAIAVFALLIFAMFSACGSGDGGIDTKDLSHVTLLIDGMT